MLKVVKKIEASNVKNHFQNKERNITDTDVALATAYFLILKEQKLIGEQ